MKSHQTSTTILLVEDSTGDAKLIQLMLEDSRDERFEVHTVSSLAGALEFSRRTSVDVVLLDLGLPDSQGMDTFIEFNAVNPEVPVVVLSGIDDRDVARHAVQKGAQDYLVKGKVDSDLLKRVLQYSIERMKVRTALHLSEERAKAQYKGIPVPTYTWQKKDDDFILIDYNDAAVVISGGEIEKLVGIKARELHEDRPDIQDDLNRCFLEKKSFERHMEYTQRKTNKQNAFIVKYAFIKPDWVLVHTEDVTEVKKAEEDRKKLNEQLRQTQKMETLGTLAGGIAHDINNILQTIFNNAYIAKEGLADKHAIQTNLDGILKAGRRAKDLVEQILTFSRRMEHQRVYIKLYTMLNEAIGLIEPSLPSNVRLVQSIGDREGVILADPTQINQVIMNLLTNAVYAMGEKEGILKITLDHVEVSESNMPDIPRMEVGDYCRLSIEDFGVGMDEKTLARVFEPFFTTKEVGEGTGLGLSVVHGIVGEHGGAITVKSIPRQGTVFDVFLPRVERQEEETAAAGLAATGGAESILYVDDDTQQIKDAGVLLERAGYKVDICGGSEEALAMFSRTPLLYDLVITDQMMPKMSGVELCKRLYEINPMLKTMIITGNVKKIPTEFNDADFVHLILKKPFSPEELVDAIRKVLDERPE